MLVNKKKLAEILGVTERSLTEWQKDGLPVKKYADTRGQENQYETREVIEWVLHKEISRLQIQKARDRLDNARAEKEELQVAEMLGRLAPAEMFEKAWADHVLAARTEFITLPETVAMELSATLGHEVDPDVIAFHVNRALEKLANYGDENDGYDSEAEHMESNAGTTAENGGNS